MIRAETVAVAVAGSALGAAIGWLGGRALLAMLRHADMVAGSVEYAGGAASSLATTAVVIVLVSSAAAGVAGRRATSGPATMALADSSSGTQRLRWWRVLGAVVLIGYGLAMAVITITVTADSDDPYDAMASSGSSSILVGVGLALLAPVLLRWLSTSLRPFVGSTGVAGHLAAFNTSRRAHLLGAVLGPVIVFTASTIGILMLVGVDGRTMSGPVANDFKSINLLNNVVVGMISVFAAIMVVNAFAAVVSQRRVELARLRLLGATPEQVRGSVVAEAGIVAGIGVGLGFLAALATVVPFAIARDEGVVPDGQLWLPPLLAAAAVAITLGAAASAVRRATATPALALAGGTE